MNDAVAATPMTLPDLLAEELRCCRRMVALAEAQRDAMLAGEVETLAPAVREMEGLATALARLEEERIARWAAATAAADPSAAEQARLRELRTALHTTLAALRVLNDANATLARRALAFTEQALRLLHAALPATYEANGALRGPEAVRRTWTV